MNLETVRAQLKDLGLKTAAGEIEQVLSRQRGAVDLGWLSELLERERDARKERAPAGRIRKAEFPELRTMEEFDWGFDPKIDRGKIEELTSPDFIRHHRIALFLGPSGLGKSHLALALGLLAARAGYRVWCASIKRLNEQILAAKAQEALDVLFKRILSSHLWILDDWGVVSMSREVAEEVFDLMDRRKYSSAMVLTSNRAIEEWGEVFPEPVLAGATIDRIFDRAILVPFEGKSYRLKGRLVLPEDGFPPPVVRRRGSR